MNDIIVIYKNLFITNNAKPYIFKSKNWYSLKNTTHITSRFLELHLANKHIYGQHFTRNGIRNFVCLDFDYSDRFYKDREEYYSFINKVCNTFFCPKFFITSSNSNNIHCYLFFRKTSAELVKSRILGSLNNCGFDILPGRLEVFISNQTLRLPFGRGSYLLDNNFYQVNMQKEEQIRLVNDTITSSLLPNIYLATPSYKYKKTIRTDLKLKNICLGNLLTDGLVEPSTMNNALVAITLYYFTKFSGDASKISPAVKYWVDNFNNGLSKDYNTNRIQIYNKIETIIKWILSKQNSYFFKYKNTSALDINICKLIYKHFNNYKIQLAIFNLFQYIKLSLQTKEELTISKRFLVDPVIGIGLNVRNYQFMMNKLEEVNLLQLINKGNNYKKHCNLYRWTGPIFENSVKCFTSWNKFIIESGNINSYSKYIQKQILSK